MGPQSLSHALHSGHCCAMGPPACLPSIMLKGLACVSGLSASDTGSQQAPALTRHGQGWLSSRASACCLVKPEVVSTVPRSEGCCLWLLWGDSIPTKHQLGGSASGREVSQEIIPHKRT